MVSEIKPSREDNLTQIIEELHAKLKKTVSEPPNRSIFLFLHYAKIKILEEIRVLH